MIVSFPGRPSLESRSKSLDAATAVHADRTRRPLVLSALIQSSWLQTSLRTGGLCVSYPLARLVCAAGRGLLYQERTIFAQWCCRMRPRNPSRLVRRRQPGLAPMRRRSVSRMFLTIVGAQSGATLKISGNAGLAQLTVCMLQAAALCASATTPRLAM